MFGLFGRGRRGGEYAPRLSDAARETGRYRETYPGWQPTPLAGDPALVPDAPRAAADRVSAELIAAAPDRAAAAGAALAVQGIAQLETAADWQRAEPVLVRMLEPSAEPQHAPFAPVLRPASLAFLVDVGCAYALALAAAHPGARLVPAGAALSGFSRTGPVWPVIAVPGRDHVLRPFETMFELAGNALEGGESDVLSRDFAVPEPVDGAADIAAWLEGFVAAEGRGPTLDEVAAELLDARIDPDDLPRDLARRLGIAD